MVGEPHPSKQGLKQLLETTFERFNFVGEPHPSKQGLKHRQALGLNSKPQRRRAPSIKTRIETLIGVQHESKESASASPIHQNKD